MPSREEQAPHCLSLTRSLPPACLLRLRSLSARPPPALLPPRLLLLCLAVHGLCPAARRLCCHSTRLSPILRCWAAVTMSASAWSALPAARLTSSTAAASATTRPSATTRSTGTASARWSACSARSGDRRRLSPWPRAASSAGSGWRATTAPSAASSTTRRTGRSSTAASAASAGEGRWRTSSTATAATAATQPRSEETTSASRTCWQETARSAQERQPAVRRHASCRAAADKCPCLPLSLCLSPALSASGLPGEHVLVHAARPLPLAVRPRHTRSADSGQPLDHAQTTTPAAVAASTLLPFSLSVSVYHSIHSAPLSLSPSLSLSLSSCPYSVTCVNRVVSERSVVQS